MAQGIATQAGESPISTEGRRQQGVRVQYIVLALIVISSAVIRSLLVWGQPFPLNDGGFVYQHMAELIENNYLLPTTLTYNGQELPYAFPPASFYIMATVSRLTSFDLLDVMRWYPVVMTSLTLPFVYLFMMTTFDRPRLGLMGTLVFAVMPSTVFGVLAGGGGPAATGMFFGVMAIWQGTRLANTEQGRYIPLTAIFTAMALMSSPRWGAFVLVSLLVLYVTSERSFQVTLQFAAVAGFTVLITLPWLYVVWDAHTLEPFINYFFGIWDVYTPFAIVVQPGQTLTLEPSFGVLNVLSLLGLCVALVRGRFTILLWFFVVMLFLPDASQEVTAVPLALLGALALDYLVIAGIGGFRRRPLDGGPRRRRYFREDWPLLIGYIAATSVILYSLMTPLYAQRMEADRSLTPIRPASRTAMAQVAADLPVEANFALMTAVEDYQEDGISAWFPVLAERRSVATVPGMEWLPDGRFAQDVAHYNSMQLCAAERIACLESWSLENNKPYTHVWFSPEAQGLLSATMRTNPNYTLVYEEDGILIFAR